MIKTRIYHNSLYEPYSDEYLSKYLHKNHLRHLSDFIRGRNQIPDLERNQFGYDTDNMGVLISDDKCFLSLELYYDNEEFALGEITFALEIDYHKKRFVLQKEFQYQLFTENDDNGPIEVIDDADYRYVLEKLCKKLISDRKLEKFLSEYVLDLNNRQNQISYE